MKKNKRAFTLAEVLIALSVTGLVAAFVIPQAVVEIQKKSAGLKLARTVEQIELGCKNLLEYENSKVTNGSYYTGITQIPEMSLAKLAPFIGLKPDSTIATKSIFKDYANIPSSILPHAYAAVNYDNSGEFPDYVEHDSSVTPGYGDETYPHNPPTSGIEKPCTAFGFAFNYITGHDKATCEKKIKNACKNSCDIDICAPYRDQGYCDKWSSNPAIKDFNEESGSESATDVNLKTSFTYKSSKGNVSILFDGPLKTSQKSKDATVVQLFIDTNGIKNKPNMYGKDVFQFDLINSGKLKPYGANNYKDSCSDTKITDGKACTARVVAEGYKINY